MHKNKSSMKRWLAGLSAIAGLVLSGLSPVPSYSQKTLR
jgi:hypothetical protein